MGSLDKALLTGFICRLCSEMCPVVYHMYSEEGIRLGIAEKINKYVSISVSPSDPLPKTICKSCLERLENQHRLMTLIEQAANGLKGQRRARVGRGSYVSMCDNSDNPPQPSEPK
ncbi:uncharacterized protein LOC128199738 [Bicyclus anynana]|uniref:Uncharacterized protein LOC112048029 n=1 Tax=Bicyclus anynana TaxID=110368 RepID=A0A6J1MZX8_BICAN|nr:uncharacterized protein LOC112048029 [Bicyclus anynana]XP_052746726.1 uncharacterized protein LOC128199738 [Bicyclus anynana]